MKKTIWIIAVSTILIGLVLCFLLNIGKNNEIDNEKKGIVQITDFNIEGRLTLKKDNNIYIGNNLKELENNFYDIKIASSQEEIQVFLNKLWYEDYGADYIQDDYLARICRELNSKLNIQSGTEQFEYVMYKYIKDNYVKVRENESVEKIFTDKYNLEFELEDNVVKLIIRRTE